MGKLLYPCVHTDMLNNKYESPDRVNKFNENNFTETFAIVLKFHIFSLAIDNFLQLTPIWISDSIIPTNRSNKIFGALRHAINRSLAPICNYCPIHIQGFEKL